jgi:UDP:flavonoid glycosyltransferase YjiC (YdhE family)
VCGPRIDTSGFDVPEGVELVGYVHDLSRVLASCDVAIAQGGLTTCMELAAAKRPFLYAPLARHFEQNLHVRHRLERYGAGRAIDLERDDIAAELVSALGNQRGAADVERDGAARAARLIGELL